MKEKEKQMTYKKKMKNLKMGERVRGQKTSSNKKCTTKKKNRRKKTERLTEREMKRKTETNVISKNYQEDKKQTQQIQ